MNKTRMLHMTQAEVDKHYAKLGKPSPIAKKVVKKPISDGYDSKLERMYALQLQARKMAHEIADWERNTKAFEYCEGHTYTPDFLVTCLDGTQIFIELKGCQREDDIIKFDIVMQQNPQYKWLYLLSKDGKLTKTRGNASKDY